MTEQPLLVVTVDTEVEVFSARQRGREAAAALGLDAQDQIRVATALSELGRELAASGGGRIRFIYARSPQRLVVDVTRRDPTRPSTPESALCLAAVRGLVDELELPGANDPWVQFTKVLPSPMVSLGPDDLEAVRAGLRRLVAASPLDEMRLQNAQLLAALEELEASRAALVSANTELEETKQGVMAMYHQLSDELEHTNRGVVALYAELDDKGHQLQLADEAKTRFLANVSHELRTPINSILGLANLLQTGDPLLSGEQLHQVALITASARELLSLVNQLLDLAKAESGRLDAMLRPTDLGEVLSDLRATMRPLITDPAVRLVIEQPPGIPGLITDPDLLVHVLRNLVSNAIKFTPSGEIRVASELIGGGHVLRISVRDTGIGISSADHERIFEEFYQVAGPLQAKTRGTGLGLPFAKRLVRLLGGQLDLTSSEGVGSTFAVELPIRAADVEAKPTSSASLPTTATVLVVDDDPTYRHVLRGMLQPLVGRVLEAADGVEAIERLEVSQPDLVLLDLRMPRLDGAEVLTRMNANPEWRKIPVVVTTSVDLDGAVLEATSLAAAVLSKSSVTPEILGRLLRDAEARR